MSGLKHSSLSPEASTSSEAPALGLSDYRFLRVLGTGSYGKVWFARAVKNDTACAIKAVQKQTRLYIGSDGLTDFEREVACMKCVDPDFPFIIEIFGHFTTPRHDFLVMEYVGCGDLKDLLLRDGPMPESQVRLYIAELACALRHLHQRNIIHRDVKLKNVVIGEDGHLKLIDFGISKVLTTATTSDEVGTLATMAPEILERKQYDYRADWYSLGVALYQMVVGQVPFRDAFGDEFAFKDKVINGTIEFPANLSADCLAVLKHLLEKNPHHRLAGLQDLLGHKWFKGYSSKSVLLKLHKPRYVPDSQMALKLSGFKHHYEDPGAKEYRGASKSYVPAFLNDRRPKRKAAPEATAHDRPRKRNAPPVTTTPPDSPR